MDIFPDNDIQETQEWLESLNSVIEAQGTERAHYLIEMLIDQARRSGSNLPYNATTAYVNTIPTHLQQNIQVILKSNGKFAQLFDGMHWSQF